MYRFLINLLEIQTDTKSIKMHCVGVCVYVGGRGGGAKFWVRKFILYTINYEQSETKTKYYAFTVSLITRVLNQILSYLTLNMCNDM